MTVSRDLRNPEQVSEALRGRLPLPSMNRVIFPIAPLTSFQRHQPRHRRAAAVVNQPALSEALRGIESVTDAFGYQTMLAHYGYKPEMEEKRLESMPPRTSMA